MIQSADYVVVGGGLYGCATAYYLAKLGASNVVLLERGAICSGATAKSCAILRTHYSIEANMAHAVASLKVFADFDGIVGGDVGFQRTGYLILGPETHREPMEEVFRNQNIYGVDTRVVSEKEAVELLPPLRLDGVGVIGYDTQTGYCDPYLVTTAYADRARELGVSVEAECPVTRLEINAKTKTLTTPKGELESPCVILTSGPHTMQLARTIGLEVPCVISRHKVMSVRPAEPYRADWPIVKDLTTDDKIYFRPHADGAALIGTGDHGEPIEDADSLTDEVDADHVLRIRELLAKRMPALAEGEYVRGWTGPYDISPDWNPIVGPVSGVENLHIAVGFSGHGFKLAPSIAEALARTVLGQEAAVSIAPYHLSRFQEGKHLYGAYGIGSIA